MQDTNVKLLLHHCSQNKVNLVNEIYETDRHIINANMHYLVKILIINHVVNSYQNMHQK